MSETGHDSGDAAENGADLPRRPSASEAALVADLKPVGALARRFAVGLARQSASSQHLRQTRESRLVNSG